MKWRIVGLWKGKPGSDACFGTHSDMVSFAQEVEKRESAILFGFAPAEATQPIQDATDLEKFITLVQAHSSNLHWGRWRYKEYLEWLAQVTKPQEKPEAKVGRLSFECDYQMLSADGKELLKTAPFNAEEAWKATKLACGDCS